MRGVDAMRVTAQGFMPVTASEFRESAGLAACRTHVCQRLIGSGLVDLAERLALTVPTQRLISTGGAVGA